jgi:hypothetical protein
VEVNKSADLSAADVGDEADQATQSSERELQFELSDNERNSLDAVEAALTEDRHRGVWGVRIVPGKNCGASVKSDSPRAVLHWVSSEVRFAAGVTGRGGGPKKGKGIGFCARRLEARGAVCPVPTVMVSLALEKMSPGGDRSSGG